MTTNSVRDSIEQVQ